MKKKETADAAEKSSWVHVSTVPGADYNISDWGVGEQEILDYLLC